MVELLRIPVGPLQANCFVLWDRPDQALVIDPGDEGERIVAELRKRGITPTTVVSTHGHFDHTMGAHPLQAAFGAKYKIHRDEFGTLRMVPAGSRLWGLEIGEPPVPDGTFGDGERWRLSGLEVELLHTPGHTPGSTSFRVPALGAVFTGDTLFAGSIGRTDFPGGDTETELRSIRERLLSLPSATKVYPGHGPSTTVANEAEHNPFLA